MAAATRPDLISTFAAGISPAQHAAVEAAKRVARDIGAALFLAGGPVRDLVLAREVTDIDIAVEGDTDTLAGRLEGATGLRVIRHGRFGTATLRGDGFSVDFARTRRETYPRPGALPEVEAASIEEDLARRDFTMNAMALRITAPEGELLDPHGGLAGIEGRRVRVLHDRSFQDDATRMLRACRYAARLDFEIDAETSALIRRDLPFLDSVSGARLRRELVLALKEPAAVTAVSAARNLGVLESIHPLLAPAPAQDDAWRQALAGPHYAPMEELGICMTASCRTLEDTDSLSKRLHLTGRLERALVDLVRLQELSDKLEPADVPVPDVVDALDGMRPAAVWAFALKRGGIVRERCLAYLQEWRRVRPSLDGFDLEAMGVPKGPGLGAMLRTLRAARLRGDATSRAEEVALVRQEFPAAREAEPRTGGRLR